MRGIKFRGKAMLSVDYLDIVGADHDDSWIVGNLIANNGNPYIVGKIIEVTAEYISHEFWVQVESNSVGQFTGLKDKNGCEIYEGDILKPIRSSAKGVYTVVWYNNGFMIEFKFQRRFMGKKYEDKNHLPIYSDSYEVIGNIYENSELLEVSK